MSDSVSSIRINTKMDNSNVKASAKEIENMFDKLKSKLSGMGKSNAISEGMAKSATEIKREMKSVEKAINDATNKSGSFAKELSKAQSELSAMEKSLSKEAWNNVDFQLQADKAGRIAKTKALSKGKSKDDALNIGAVASENKMNELIEKNIADNKEYQKKLAQIEKINQKLTVQKDIISKNTSKQQELNNTDVSKNDDKKLSTQSKINQKMKEQNIFAKMFSKSTKQSNSGLGNMFKSLSKLGMAFIGIRSVFMLIRRAMNEVLSENEKLKNTMEAMWASVGALIEPIVTKIIQLLATAISYAFAFIQALSGLNLFAKTSEKIKKKNAKGGGSDSRSAAKFDELNVLSKNGGAGGGANMGLIEEVKLNEKQLAIVEKLKAIWEKIATIGSNLKNNILEGWNANNNGLIIMESIKSMGESIYQGFIDMLDATVEWSANLNFVPMFDSLVLLFPAIADSVQLLVDLFVFLYENALLPIGKWIIESGLPAFFEMLASYLSYINTIMETLKPGLMYIWDNFVVPLTTDVGNMIITILNLISESYKKMAQFIQENSAEITKSLEALSEIFNVIWTAIKIILANAMVSFSAATGFAIGLIGEILVTLGSFINNVKMVFSGLIDFIVGVFTLDWKRAWKGIVDIFKGIFNRIVDIVQVVINSVISGINAAIRAINSFGIKIPDWIPIWGGSTLGVKLNEVNRVTLPRLAKGAVIPPNKEFMAVLGDQTRGTNIETPENLLRQIFRDENKQQNDEIVRLLRIIANKEFGITKRDIGEASVEYVNDEFDRTGNNPILVF